MASTAFCEQQKLKLYNSVIIGIVKFIVSRTEMFPVRLMRLRLSESLYLATFMISKPISLLRSITVSEAIKISVYRQGHAESFLVGARHLAMRSRNECVGHQNPAIIIHQLKPVCVAS